MKKITQLLFLLLISSGVFGQDLKGKWNGSLSVQGNQYRIVFHVDQKNNQYTATMDSPDQDSKDVPVTAISFNSPNVKFEISNIGMSYEGDLSDNRITGLWKQAGQSFPLVMSKENVSKE
jgi:hypothetical protein